MAARRRCVELEPSGGSVASLYADPPPRPVSSAATPPLAWLTPPAPPNPAVNWTGARFSVAGVAAAPDVCWRPARPLSSVRAPASYGQDVIPRRRSK